MGWYEEVGIILISTTVIGIFMNPLFFLIEYAIKTFKIWIDKGYDFKNKTTKMKNFYSYV